jgi:hypothetical protein
VADAEADGKCRPGLNLATHRELTNVVRSDSAWAAFAVGLR